MGMLREQAAVANQIMKQLERQGEGGNPDEAEVDFEYLKFAEFRKANPPSFRGTFDPYKAEE